jgi:hypothetical protein
MSAVIRGNEQEDLKFTSLSCHKCPQHDHRRSFVGSCRPSALVR